MENLTKVESMPLSIDLITGEQLKKMVAEFETIKNNVSDLMEFKEEMPLLGIDCDELQSLVSVVAIKTLGGKNSTAYNNKPLRSRLYADIQVQIRREFGVRKYKGILHKHLQAAKDIVSNYKPPFILQQEINSVNNQIGM